jgi:NAD(P)-dependent dehydrogenase (short-subunit alcohol dehydrogenase family)
MDLKLKDRLALVSGSTAGIGFAIAKALAGEGARVIVNGRTQTAVDEAVASLRSDTGASVEAFAGDLTTASAADALFARFPRGGDPGQQPRHLRAEAVRGDHRRGHRDERRYILLSPR